jgi:hypothetical protein
MIADAVRRGELKVLKVYYFAKNSRWGRMNLEGLESLPKSVLKPLYTRMWGKMLSRSSLSVSPVERGTSVKLGDYWWRAKLVEWDAVVTPRTYSPGIGSWVAAINHARMVADARTLSPGSLVAAHVDALWTSDIEGAQRLCGDGVGQWKMKGRGILRFPAVGRYYMTCKNKVIVGHSGTKRRPQSPKELVDGTIEQPRTRGWNQSPKEAAHAVSVAPSLKRDRRLQYGYPPDAKEVWDPLGFLAGTRSDDA